MIENRLKGTDINGATSQLDRLLRSKAGGDLKIDAQTFADLASFAAEFGDLVNFFNLADELEGDWCLFFLCDPTVLLALIDSADLVAIEAHLWDEFGKLVSSQKESLQNGAIRAYCEWFLDIAKRLDGWLLGARQSQNSAAARHLARDLASLIDVTLGVQLKQLGQIFRELEESPDLEDYFENVLRGFSSSWQAGETTSHHSRWSQEDPEAKLRRLLSQLEHVVTEFLLALREVQNLARKYLPETLLEDDHKPQVGLYLAFVSLFGHAQNTLNSVVPRFKEFYYTDVLRERPQGPTADKVYLLCALDPKSTVTTATVPAGTQFIAGKESDGSSIFYAADVETTVTNATLTTLRSLRIVSGPGRSPASPSPTKNVQQVFATVIDVDTMQKEAQGKGDPSGLVPWATFGETEAGSTAISKTSAVSFGFAIASPYLFLTGGWREVSVTFPFTPSGALLDELQELAQITGLSIEAVFETVLDQSLNLWLSMETGWFPPDSFSCSSFLSGTPTQFSITFKVGETSPALTAFNPDPKAPPPTGPDALNPEPLTPTLKVYVNQDAILVSGPQGQVDVYPLSIITPLDVSLIEIRSTTSNFTDLKIATSSGAVDPRKPFPVFGGTPVVGSFFEFSNPELFAKQITSGTLSIDLTWYGLPQNTTGFAGYYRGYVVGLDGTRSATPLFDNRSFQAGFSVVNPGNWDFASSSPPASPPQGGDEYLFRTQDSPDSPIPSVDSSLASNAVFEDLATTAHTSPPYYDPGSSAIRLTLSEPPYAFGNVLYAPNVMNAALAKLPRWNGTAETEGDGGGLNAAADSLDAFIEAAIAKAPAKSDVLAAVRKIQEQLLLDAQNGVAGAAGSEDPNGAAWLQGAITVSGSMAPAYRARTIAARLQQAVGQSGGSPPVPDLTPETKQVIGNSLAMLDGVIWIQQALDACVAETPDSYLTAVISQLSKCALRLRQAGAAMYPFGDGEITPSPPWMPQAQGLSVGYSAETSFLASELGGSSGAFYYLLPFTGYTVPPTQNTIPLVDLLDACTLELGFTGEFAQQPLALLIQTTAGAFPGAQGVVWQWYGRDGWQEIPQENFAIDTTNGLQNTGLLVFNGLESSGGLWLRGVSESPSEFPDMIGIYPNVLTATWQSDQGGSGAHLAQPLPAYTISSSLQNLPSIKSICQPIESFGGAPAEDWVSFPIRLSERLRHKGRAVLPWDFENLVLESFPSIWKVQCLPASLTRTPGEVTIVVVPGTKSIQIADPTAPLASGDLLQLVQASLASVATPFLTIQVVNPIYVRICVTAKVEFRTSGGGGGIDTLNADLVSYLSPWFYDMQRATMEGSYATQEAICQHILTRPYVNSLVAVSFGYDPVPEDNTWYFLTSAKKHDIIDVIKN